MNLDEKGRCLFQDEDGGCGVFRRLGQGYLSSTCTNYPRRMAMLDGQLEFSLSMSCPEVVRIALFSQKEAIFQEKEKEFSENDPLVFKMPPSAPTLSEGQESLRPHLRDIRNACIAIVKTRACSISERLLALGLMLRKLDSLAAGA
jgi:lysine-N-methylase